MKAKINSNVLYPMLRRAADTSEKRALALLDARDGEIVVTAFNGDCWLIQRARAGVSAQGCALVDADDLRRMVRLIQGELTLEVKPASGAQAAGEFQLSVRGPDSRAALRCDDVENAIAPPDQPDGVITFATRVEPLADAVQLVASAIDPKMEATRPLLTTLAMDVRADELRLLAASPYVGARASVQYTTSPEDNLLLTLPLGAHRVLSGMMSRLRDDLCRATLHRNYARFEFGGMTLIALPIGTTYVDLEKMLDRKRSAGITLPLGELMAAVKLCLSISQVACRLRVTTTGLTLLAQDERGDISTSIAGSGGTGNWQVDVNPTFLRNALGQMMNTGVEDVTLRVNPDERESIRIDGGVYSFLIMTLGPTK